MTGNGTWRVLITGPIDGRDEWLEAAARAVGGALRSTTTPR